MPPERLTPTMVRLIEGEGMAKELYDRSSETYRLKGLMRELSTAVSQCQRLLAEAEKSVR